MKILFLSQIVPYPPHGGVLQRGYNILREICKYNEVHLLAYNHPDILGSEEAVDSSRRELGKHCASIEYFPLWPKRSVMHKLAAFGLAMLYPKPFSVLAHKSAAYQRAIRRAITEFGIDLVHIDTIGLAPYRELAADLPCVLTHHNIESLLMERRAEVETGLLHKYYVGLQARRLRAYEAAESPRFDMNIVMSSVDEGELRRIAPGVATAIVPNGVDTGYFSSSVDGHEKAAIYTGGMNMYANKDAVLYFLREIWPAVLREHPDARFYVIGQDPPVELHEYSRRETSVIVTGYVDDVRPYVRKAAVYVVPLRVGGGTRLKVLDALAQGKAIVSTSLGCEGISVVDGLNIHIEDTPERFAARVSSLFADAESRRMLGTAARNLAKSKYDWNAIGIGLQKVYEEVVRGHAGAQQH